MAIAGTVLSADSSAGTSPYTTASVAFANSKLYICSIVSRSSTTHWITGITGGGLTWVRVSSLLAGETQGVAIWCGFVDSGATTDALTITYDVSPARAAWSIEEWTGTTATAANNGADAFGAPARLSGTAASASVTLGAFADATNNVAYGVFGHRAQETSTVDSTPAGYAALTNVGYGAVSALGQLTEWNTGEDLAVAASWATSSILRAAAVEIKAAAAAATSVNVDTPGAVTWTGQAVGLTTSIGVTAGAVTWAGQTTGLKVSIQPTAGAVVWTGSSVALVRGIVPIAGSVTYAGQVLPLRFTVGVAAGQIAWNGSTVTLIGPPVPGVGLPVENPQAILIGTEGQGFVTGLEGKAVLQEV